MVGATACASAELKLISSAKLATFDTEARQAQMVADDLEALLAGKAPVHIVNPEVLGP